MIKNDDSVQLSGNMCYFMRVESDILHLCCILLAWTEVPECNDLHPATPH